MYPLYVKDYIIALTMYRGERARIAPAGRYPAVSTIVAALVIVANCSPSAASAGVPAASFSFVSSTHIYTPSPCPESCRGAHFVAASTGAATTRSLVQPHQAPPRVFSSGILGQVAELSLGNATEPAALLGVTTSQALEQARVVAFPSSNSSNMLVAGQDFLLYDVAAPARPSLLANATTPMRGWSGGGDNGVNGVVLLAAADHTLVVGAAMPGLLVAARLAQPASLEYAGALDLSTAAGGSGPRLERAFDASVLRRTGGGALVSVVAAVGQGVVATFAVDVGAAPSNWTQVGATWTAPSTAGWSTHTGCNRVRAYDGVAFVACFGVGEHGVVVAVDLDVAAPQLLWQREFVDKQPTGMLLSGRALVVAGGRDLMVWNVSDARRAGVVVASCGAACSAALPGEGQNAHSMALVRDGARGRLLLAISAQVSNNIGVVSVDDPAVVALLNARLHA